MRRFIVLACVLSAVGCQAGGCHDTASDGKLRVVATTSILADTVRRVGGERVHVECLMGLNDPHRFTASAGDINKLHNADLILFHGLHLEGKMDDVLSKNPPKKAVAVCEKIDPKKLRRGDHGGDGPHDPHVWMDPALWIQVVEAVRDELCAADPAHKSDYEKNAAAFIVEIKALDAENRRMIATIPEAKRNLVTSHDAFAYFGAAYGLQVRGLQGISTVAEPSTQEVSALAEFLGANRVPAVFAESSVPPKAMEAVLDAVRKKYSHSVKLVGGKDENDPDKLYSDALGEPGSGGETYIGMIRHNVSVIVNALK